MFYEPLIINNNVPYLFTSVRSNYPCHWHSELELLICTKGSFCVDVEGQAYTIGADEAIIIPGYTAHAIVSSSPDFRRITITFGYAFLGNEYKAIQNAFLYTNFRSPQTPEKLRRAFELIVEALSGCDCVTADNDWQTRSGLYLLASQLRLSRSGEQPPEEQQSRIQRLDSIYSVLDYVAQHYAEKLSVEEAAEIAGYAKTYFCRQFKLTTGVSFHRYLNNYRVSVACRLLEDPKISIGEVAARTGFSSAKLFCRTFKEITGMTTSQYQKLSPEEKNGNWMH